MTVATRLDQSFRNIVLNVFFKLTSKKGNPRLMFMIKETIENNIKTLKKRKYAPNHFIIRFPENDFLESDEYVKTLTSYIRKFIYEYYKSRSYRIKSKPVEISIQKTSGDDVKVYCSFRKSARTLQPENKFKVKITTPGGENFWKLSSGREFTVGRGDEVDIRINHILVSRKHAEIRVTPQGGIHIKDCNSTNGLVKENGEKVSGKSNMLVPGNKISIGKHGTISLEIVE